ncbi:hypothetical protein COCNU_01G013640 [Cocos nucifera]|uniref:Uncharacterized protein n=1 Tax=Cocos nucifera TaxID=13894 RepID=A0A8K0MVH3_COCNU|nr:hypothetical protein COCNU_01G013640 [Cocos nucifera]
MEELKRLKVPTYSNLLREDLLWKPYFGGLTLRGLTFSREELEGLVGIDSPRKKKEKKKRRRVVRSSSLEVVIDEAVAVEAIEQREK